MNWRRFHDRDWLGFNWSRWMSLNPANGELSEIATDEGLYRVRHGERDELTYIGETGRSIRGRVRSLSRGAYADEMPFRDPHVAAPCHWAIHQEDGPEFQVSYITPEEATDKATRKSLESALIASYRRAAGNSPTAAFSRIIPGYRMSTYRRKSERGGLLERGETEAYAEPGISPLDWDVHDDPRSTDWMGLNWSQSQDLSKVSTEIPSADGVYRIWDPDSPLPLEYIGESANLRSRLRTHSSNRHGDLCFSYAAPDFLEAKHKRLEAETDLIGAHWLTVQRPPRDQH